MSTGQGQQSPDLAVDLVVHAPARLAILSVLEGQKEADFQFLHSVGRNQQKLPKFPCF